MSFSRLAPTRCTRLRWVSKECLISGALFGHLASHRFPGEHDQLRFEADPRPVQLDLLLHLRDRQIGQVASGALLVATEAEEVGIQPSGLASGEAEGEARVSRPAIRSSRVASPLPYRTISDIRLPPGAIRAG